MKQDSILCWTEVDSKNWSYRKEQLYYGFVIFELSKVPDFSEPRFEVFGEKNDARLNSIIGGQLKMLRQLYGLEHHPSLALRLKRISSKLSLFIVAKLTGAAPVSEESLEILARRIRMTFPNEYHLQRITPDKDDFKWRQALDLSWAGAVDEIFKTEFQMEYGISDLPNARSLPFYVAGMWQPVANDMELLCRTLINSHSENLVDILLTPVSFDEKEREWVDAHLKRLKRAETGETIHNLKLDPIPGLRIHVENYENLLKRYSQGRLFLTSFRVFSSGSPSEVTQALIAGATKTAPQIVGFKAGDPLFDLQISAGAKLEIAPESKTDYWNKEADLLPFRAQRLNRLADLEEIAGFWRFPIPFKPGFPGFELDTGLGGTSPRNEQIPDQIVLGKFADEPAGKEEQAVFDIQQLTKHGLITGVPGSGKTTAVFNILHQLWNKPEQNNRVPFMVLEPAKTEYRALKSIGSFQDDLWIFTLGDERISPFRFNPLEVMEGVPLESHISRLNACFNGAFNLIDPLPMLLDKAIRETYFNKGWFDESLGGEPGVETPTLSDLYCEAQKIVKNSGYSNRTLDDINAALLQRLDLLRRGSKGRMLDTSRSIPFKDLMSRPLILELDALNQDEKALLMMFILTFIYESAKTSRKSGSPLKHLLVVEEAHNLIGRGDNYRREQQANPKEQAIRLFTQMLAEMRALGQGILIADQLPSAIAPEAMKQTNLKILLRLTAKDDREEIGNTMDLSEAHLKDAVHFKSGQSYVYLEDWDRVRRVDMANYKKDYQVEEPPDDGTLKNEMRFFEEKQPDLFQPYPDCAIFCRSCNRRTRSQAEQFAKRFSEQDIHNISILKDPKIREACKLSLCQHVKKHIINEKQRLEGRYANISDSFIFCAYIHLIHAMEFCQLCRTKKMECFDISPEKGDLFKNLLNKIILREE